MAEYHSGEKETWNMAQATLKRLSWLMDRCSIASQSKNFKDWFYVMMDFRRNLFPFMTDKQFEDVKTKFGELPKNWIATGNATKEELALVHKTLDEIYMEFMKIMKSKGILMTETKDAGKAIINY